MEKINIEILSLQVYRDINNKPLETIICGLCPNFYREYPGTG